MKSTPSNPENAIRSQLEMHLRAIRNLVLQLDPAERNAFVSEMIMEMIPSRSSKPQSTSDKLRKKKQPGFTLSQEDQKLISELDKKTAELFEQLSGKAPL